MKFKSSNLKSISIALGHVTSNCITCFYNAVVECSHGKKANQEHNSNSFAVMAGLFVLGNSRIRKSRRRYTGYASQFPLEHWPVAKLPSEVLQPFKIC